MRCSRTAIVALVTVVVATACRTPARGTVRVSGSSALSPLLNVAKERFETAHREISVEVSAGGSQKGLSDVVSGAVEIGASDIEPPEALRDRLVDHRVAVTGVAVMAHRGPYNERVAALGMSELAGIFSGRLRSWKDVGGEPQPIVVIHRPAGSGTRAVFARGVLHDESFVESRTEDNSGALVAKLKQTEGAISYLALAYRDDALLTLGVRGAHGDVMPTVANIARGAYPLWTYEHLYTRRETTASTRAFLDYVTGAEFQALVPTLPGFFPVSVAPPESVP